MRKLLLAALLASAALAGCSKADSNADKPAPAARPTDHDSVPAMTVDEVDAALTAKQAIAIDCNNERTRKRMGTIPGAILISDDASYPASELPADKTTKLVFFCANPG